jgi:hypothetical protein
MSCRDLVALVIAAALAAVFAPATALAAPASAQTPPQTQPLRRFALVIGSNNGGGDRDHLRYAGHDASTFADVLEQLGGVRDADLSLLREPDAHALDAAFDALSQRIRDERKHGQRVELVVYYSGHSDETGILLGGAHYEYAHLRQRIGDVPADVHIAILDSCASGSFTRAKGGSHTAPFLRDTSNQVEGFAYLSSSSADEDAQESDKIGASFFTYYFVAALRGAADRNHDGRVTLTEAYEFAYEETLGRTQNTSHGPQHAAYDMHLSGTGDEVITDLRSTETALVLPSALRGRVTIQDANGQVAVELMKDAGEPMDLALPDATYSIHVDADGKFFVATITLDHPGEVKFDQGTLRQVAAEDTVARGGDDDGEADSDSDSDDDTHPRRHHHHHDGDERSPWYRTIPASFDSGIKIERPATPMNYDALITLGGMSREVHGAPVVGVAETGQLSLGGSVGDNMGFAYAMDLGFGPGVFVGDNLQIGATIGFGLSGVTSGIEPFAWEMPTEIFAVLELSKDIKPVVYFRQSYIYDSDSRKRGAPMALWGDEAEAGAGLKFSGKLDGYVFGSLREAMGQRYWGIGLGTIL